MSNRTGARRVGRPVRATVTTAILALIALVFLAGCGSGGDSTPAAPSPTGVALPSDFPKEQVPLLGGAILSAGGTAADGWNLTIQGPADVAAALDTAVKALTDSGYKQVQQNTQGGNRVVVVTATKAGKTYTVEVGSVAGAAGGPNSVFYQVSTT